MRGFIKNALRCAAFVAGLVLILLLLSPVAVPKGNAARNGMHHVPASGIDGEAPGTIDALFVGDSECYYSFNPLLFWQERGYATYVCGTPNQKMYESLQWVERACRNQSPRLIVLETDGLFIPITLGEQVMARMKELLPVLDYHNRWKSLNREDFYAKPEYTHLERNKGYVYDSDIAPAEDGDADYMSETGETEEITRTCQAYLRRVAAFCRERDIRLVLVSAPSMTGWGAAYRRAAAALAERLELEYIDLNERVDEIGIDWSQDSFDAGYHMNASGALKVSAYFMDYLDGTGLLADHRGEEAYAPWDKALEQAIKKGMELALPGSEA